MTLPPILRARIGAMSLSLLAMAAPVAHAAVVQVSGDLGSGTFSGPIHLPIGAQNTTHFQKSINGLGIVFGDAFARNIGGTQFELKITNLQFISNNPVMTPVRVHISAIQNYETPSAVTYNASHAVSGTWSGASDIFATCTQDYLGSNVSLTPLTANSTNMPNAFSDGPYGATVVQAPAPVYHILADVYLTIVGSGNIDLPGSYEAGAIAVPAPAAIVPLGALVLFPRRRRGRRAAA